MGRPEDAESRSWEAKTFQASLLRAFAFLVPIFVSILTGVAVGAALPPPETRTGTVVWWISVFVASTAGLIAADRLTRRLLPLATLLRLSMVFPDRAPSRVKLARRVTGSRAIANELEKAGKAGLEGDRQQAAETILALVGALGDYDSRTRGHSERTQLFVTMLADELKLKPEDKGRLMWAALVHDIGKLKVPHEVLNKPGKPDEHEWHVLKSHPHQGALICEPLKQWMGEWWLAIEQHHEKYDGSGYPRGLAGAQISYGARIVTVADSYEVMTASRPYKRPMTAAAAREELTRCSGAHFDPTVVRAFLNISLGRMHRSAGPIAWIAQLLAVRPGPILGQILGGAGAAAGAAAAALGLQIAPSWSSPPPPQVPVTAPAVVESPKPDEQPEPDAAHKPRPDRNPLAPPVFIPPEPIVPIGVLPPPATEPEPLGPPTPEPAPTKPGEPAKPEPNEPKPNEPKPQPGPVKPSTRGDSLVVDEDSSGSVDVLANDDPGDAESLSLTGAGGARHGSVSTSPSGSVTYTPALNYHGLDSVSYQARTPDGTVITGSVAITVQPINDAPVAVADSVTVAEDSSGTAVAVLANDVDVDGDVLRVTGASGAAHGSVAVAGGGITYTPAANYQGPDSFSYTIADPAGETSSATVTVTVSSGQDPPVAVDDAMTILEDAAATAISMLGNDSDPDGDPLTVSSVDGVKNGVIDQPTPGSWTYMPNLNFNGIELLTYVVSDGKGGTASAKVSITVTAVNDPPVAVDDSLETDEDIPLLLTQAGVNGVLYNDGDPDNDPLTVTMVTGAVNGVLSETSSGSGVWSYTPNEDFNGSENLSYTISDGALTASATITLTVEPVNDAPSAAPDAYVTTPGILTVNAANGLLSNDSDIESPRSSLRVTGVSPNPIWLTVNADGSFEAIDLVVGTYAFDYTVTDNASPVAASSVGRFTITVSAAPSQGTLYLQPGPTNEVTGVMDGGTSAPAPNPPGSAPVDYDNDGNPGLTIKSGGEQESETDPTKYHQWLYTVPAGGLNLNGPVKMKLWTSLEGQETKDLDYSGFFYECDGSGANCVKFLEIVDIRVNDWNATAGFEEQVVTIGSASRTITAGNTLRLRVGFGHKDVWLGMDDARPSSLNLTLD